MVLLEAGTLPEGGYVGLWHLQELRGIEDTGDAIEIGALTTYTEICVATVAAGRVAAALPRGRGDRRRGHAEPRHDRREHRQRLARR